MCEKLIMSIFDTREEAVEYLIDMEYLHREHEDKSKNILWNCFGDLIYANICNNKCCPNVRQRRKHYETDMKTIRKIENKVVDILKNVPDNSVQIYKEEIKWINSLPYKKGCNLDRDLLYVLLVLQKRYNDRVRIFINRKKHLTCNTIDKWFGKDICVCRNGLIRLQEIGVISVEVTKRKYYDVMVCVPEIKENEVAFSVAQWNPVPEFYEYNGERKVKKCIICGKKFIKERKSVTCSDKCSIENRKRNKRKSSA